MKFHVIAVFTVLHIEYLSTNVDVTRDFFQNIKKSDKTEIFNSSILCFINHNNV